MPCNYCSEEACDNAYKILAENSYSALVDNKIKTKNTHLDADELMYGALEDVNILRIEKSCSTISINK